MPRSAMSCSAIWYYVMGGNESARLTVVAGVEVLVGSGFKREGSEGAGVGVWRLVDASGVARWRVGEEVRLRALLEGLFGCVSVPLLLPLLLPLPFLECECECEWERGLCRRTLVLMGDVSRYPLREWWLFSLFSLLSDLGLDLDWEKSSESGRDWGVREGILVLLFLRMLLKWENIGKVNGGGRKKNRKNQSKTKKQHDLSR